MTETLENIVNYITHLPVILKYCALIFSVAIEYIFPIFPGDTIVFFAGFLNAQGAFDLMEIAISILIGTVLGAFIAYQLGAFLKNHQHSYSWLKNLSDSKAFARFNIWYKKWGSLFLLFNRFFSGIRAFFFIAAGASHVPLAKVLILGALSAVLFNGCLVFLGYLAGYNAHLIINYFYQFNMLIYIILSLAIIGGLTYLYIKKKRR